MSRIVIAFLGKYPKETRYAFKGKVYTGRVFPEALREFVHFDQMLVFVTEEAREHAWPVLEGLGDARIQAVSIPRGETTVEMWAMFDAVMERIDRNDTVIFDITHGLRSAPFLVFLFSAFLKIARNVVIEAIYYGAFELGNPAKDIPAPVIDLSEFVTMLDWLTATNQFTKSGDGQALAQLLRAEMPPGIQMGSDQEARDLGRQLRSAAESIEVMSNALRVARPIEGMQSASDLLITLERTQAQVSAQAPPFEALSEQIARSYGQFELDQPIEEHNILTNLHQQLKMIRWYLDGKHVVQAILMAREWLVSVVAFQFGLPIMDELKGRKPSEQALNSAARRTYEPEKVKTGPMDETFLGLPDVELVIALWQRLTNARNDIAHCGMRLSAKESGSLIKDAEAFYMDLERIKNTVLPPP